MPYGILCTPGGLLRDERSGNVICYGGYAEAEAEALRLTREAYAIRALPDLISLRSP
jgi:hypothetical protein